MVLFYVRKKKWFSWRPKSKLLATIWKFRWIRSLLCCRNRSTCMLGTSRGVRVWSVAWLSRKETLLKSCAETKIRHARQWNSSRPIGLQLRRRERVLAVVLLPRLDVKALSKAIFAHKHSVSNPILLPLLKALPSISCSLVSNEIRASSSQALMPVRVLMEITATLMSFKLCVTFSGTNQSSGSISQL